MNKLYSINKKSLLLAILIFQFFVVQQVKSQISAYSFTQNTITPYSEIIGGTVVATATGSSGVSSLDDVIYNLPTGTIPFSFVINNLSYTGCNLRRLTTTRSCCSGGKWRSATPAMRGVTDSTGNPRLKKCRTFSAANPTGGNSAGNWVCAT